MSGPVGPADARRMWQLFEPVHAVVYFAPQARAAFEAAGLRGFWRGYFAGRVAAMGAVGPEVVTAVCHGFAPAHVARAVPDIWSRVTPAQALAARAAGARASLEAALAATGAPATGPAGAAEAAELIGAAAAAVDTGGRALAAATAAVPRPDGPLDAIWHAATVLREHRGDGHVAALVAEGVTGLQALVLRAGADLDRALLQPARGWTDAQWDAAVAVLAERELVTAPRGQDGVTTAAGRDLLARVEAVTDRLAAEPWTALGRDGTERLAALIGPLSAAARGVLPVLTPIGLPPAPG